MPRTLRLRPAALLIAGTLVGAVPGGCALEGPAMARMLTPVPAGKVAPAPRGISSSFAAFCSQWMHKLDSREKFNRKKATARSTNGRFVVEYTGYSHEPVRCEATPSSSGRGDYIGKLVYHELRYRHAGPNRKAARNGKPEVVDRIEVLEIFRNDGTGWLY